MDPNIPRASVEPLEYPPYQWDNDVGLPKCILVAICISVATEYEKKNPEGPHASTLVDVLKAICKEHKIVQKGGTQIKYEINTANVKNTVDEAKIFHQAHVIALSNALTQKNTKDGVQIFNDIVLYGHADKLNENTGIIKEDANYHLNAFANTWFGALTSEQSQRRMEVVARLSPV